MKYFTHTKKIYVHEIAAANILKLCFLKNAKKTCKPNNLDLKRDLIGAKTFEKGRDFWQVNFLWNAAKDGGNVISVKNSSHKSPTLSRNLNKRHHLNTNVRVMILAVIVSHYYFINKKEDI